MATKNLSAKKVYKNKGVLSDAIYFDQAESKKKLKSKKPGKKLSFRNVLYRAMLFLIFSNYLLMTAIAGFFSKAFLFFERAMNKFVMHFVKITLSVDEQ